MSLTDLILFFLLIFAPIASAEFSTVEKRIAEMTPIQLLEAVRVQLTADVPNPPRNVQLLLFGSIKTDPALELQGLLECLSEAESGSALRVNAVALARRFSSPNELAADADGVSDWNRDREKLNYAWKILQATGVLRPGIRAEDAVAVLGSPSSQFVDEDTNVKVLRWYYKSPMHVNPYLDLHLQEGIVIKIDIGRA